MRKALFHVSFIVAAAVCLFLMWLIAAQAQLPPVPTGPVVRMTAPVTSAVDMYADGSTILHKQPVGTVPRVPPQDSNDIAQKFALLVCELQTVYASTPSIQALLDKHKVKCQ